MNFSLILPTYNESENLKKLIPEIRGEFPDTEIIVVDDNSPDGTAEIARDLGAKVILRPKKEGLGAALKDGYNQASQNLIVSMDADCSFSVLDIYRLIEKLKTHDLVVGSKYSRGSQADCFDSQSHQILSYLGNKFFIILFRLPVDDVTANFRAFRKTTWEQLDLQEKSNVFLLEMLIDTKYKKFKIAQIPVVLTQRTYGRSKTNLKKLFPLYLKFFIRQIFRRFNINHHRR